MKNKKGFTLIELLGVIVILGLVFALVIPGLIKIFKKSNKSIDEATEKLIISSAEDYLKNFELSNKYNHYCIQVINLVEEGYLDEKIESNLGNEDYYVKVNYNKGKAEYSVVDKCNPMLYNVTLSATSNKIKVVVGDEFNKNIKKYYYSLDNNSFYESESNVYTFENLNFNTEYTVYIKVLDDKNLESDVYKFKTKTNTSVNPEIAITNVPISKKNEYLKSQSFKIDYKDDGIENPIYYFKSTRKADIDVDVVESCGKNKQPSSCETIPNTKNIEENTWYKVSKNINVLYDDTSSISGELIAITGDGYNYNGYTTSNISKIDATTPELEFTSQQESYRDIYLNYEIIEEHSGLNEYTCKYGTDENSYNNYVAATNTSCHIENLSLNKKYYYEICASDNVSNKNCINGSATTMENLNPVIVEHSADATDGYEYALSRTMKITYGNTGINNLEYYFKSTVQSTVESGVITHSCGTSTEPSNCTSSVTTTLVANTWYKTSSTTPLIKYETNGELYALIKNNNGTIGSSWGSVTKVDSIKPQVEVTVSGKTATFTITDNIGIFDYLITYASSGETITSGKCENKTRCVVTYDAIEAGEYDFYIFDIAANDLIVPFTIESSAFCSYAVGDKWTFEYNGTTDIAATIQEFEVPCSGTYKLEVWGAQGGSSEGGELEGGLGGYAKGNIELTEGKKIYVVVGGKGNSGSGAEGGYNGGGTTAEAGGSGGGATHIATSTGLLSSLSSNTSSVLIVAGGGGGSDYENWNLGWKGIGGTGGGTVGGDGYGAASSGSNAGKGGTFSAAGSGAEGTINGGFGYGGSGGGGAGGGGWYGGGAGWQNNGTNGGGGGSGYVGGVNNGNMENGVREGHGYAEISVVSLN